MKVRAIAPGTYDNRRFNGDGETFHIHPVLVPDLDARGHKIVKDGVVQMKTISEDQQFSAEWMEKADGATVEEKAADIAAAKAATDAANAE